ncbi:MAG: hypothetical protein K2M94_06095 [Paramuribaculum sp.]|nr:hypothetical protein [Paramuribaculum sp.]
MAFRLIKKIDKFPDLYPKVERKLPTVKDKGWTRVGGFLLRDKVDYIPQPGLQENFCACESNTIYLCGAATMGKTFSMIFKVLYGIDKKGFSSAMISKRLQDSKKGGSIFRDNEILLGAFAGCESNSSEIPTFYWPHWLSAHRLTHSSFNTNNPAERAAFIEMAKKNQNGLQQFDEADAMEEFEYNYWQSRNRDDSGMEPQSTYSFNPPGPDHYLTRNLVNAGYIGEDWYFKPEMNGATRYYYKLGDSVDDYIWGDTREEVAERAGITLTQKEIDAGLTPADLVKSFTAFTGEAADNLMLVSSTGGQSISNLAQTGKTQRAVLKGGYFGPIDNEEINVNKKMLQQLWDNPVNDDENLYASLDVASGKEDSAPLIIWRGLQMIAIEYFKGEPDDLSPWVKSNLARYNVPFSNFVYDSTGHGYWTQALFNGIGVTFNKQTVQEYDEYGNPTVVHNEFYKLRSQLLGKLEVMLKRGEISCIIPKDKLVPFGKGNQLRRFIDVLTDGVDLFRTTIKNGKTYYRSKEEFKARFKYSPGELDSMALRMYLELDTRERKQPKPQVADDAYDALYASARRARYGRTFLRRY